MAALSPQNLLDITLQNVYRPYNFKVSLSFPFAISANPIKDSVLGLVTTDIAAKATSLPKMQSGVRDIKYMGRTFKLPNKLNLSGTWRVTFYMDEVGALQDKFEKWMYAIDNFYQQTQSRSAAPSDIDEVYGSASVIPTLSVGPSIKTYTLNGLFPIEIDEIQVGDDLVGRVSEYTVTFAYSGLDISNDSISIYNLI